MSEPGDFKEDTSKGKSLVYYTATWCGPCQKFSPQYDALSKTVSDVKFLKVDVDEMQEVAMQAGIQVVEFKDLLIRMLTILAYV